MYPLLEMLKLIQEIQVLLTRDAELNEKIDALWRQFGDTVRETRRIKNITLEDLAGKLGNIKRSQLSYLETGERKWDLETAMRVMEALK